MRAILDYDVSYNQPYLWTARFFGRCSVRTIRGGVRSVAVWRVRGRGALVEGVRELLCVKCFSIDIVHLRVFTFVSGLRFFFAIDPRCTMYIYTYMIYLAYIFYFHSPSYLSVNKCAALIPIIYHPRICIMCKRV